MRDLVRYAQFEGTLRVIEQKRHSDVVPADRHCNRNRWIEVVVEGGCVCARVIRVEGMEVSCLAEKV